MRSHQDDRERVERLKAQKKHIGENYSRFPVMDWFRRDPPPERVEGVRLEKGDVPAMILAVLSLVIPWVLIGGVVIALFIIVFKLAFGS